MGVLTVSVNTHMHDEEERKQGDESESGPSDESLGEIMDETDDDEDEGDAGGIEEESDEKAWE